MSKIAHVFKDGNAVMIMATATKPNGDPLPQAGKRGTIIGTPKPGRHMVDVPGMPLVNLSAQDLEPAGMVISPPALDSALLAAVPVQRMAYAFDVLPLNAIVTSLTNPRTHFEPLALQSLADSIASDGLGQPILVRPLPGSRLQETFADRRNGEPRPTHEIVAGERRYRACLLAGVRTVPVLIRGMSDEQVLRMQLIENVQREGLHPLEEAQGYRRIIDLDSQADKSMAGRVEELAHGVKKSTRYVYQTLQLLQLCDFARQVFLEDKLQRTTALQVARIGNEAQQIEATRRIAGLGNGNTAVINDPLSQRAAADYVQRTFMLVLSKAPFPVAVTLAGAPACGDCPKMSNNAKHLFDEGHKSPDTCMDPSCYGQKNVAHGNTLAEAARAKGQRVITGAEAKKLMPYERAREHLQGNFQALDERSWDVEPAKQGQTIRQLLGKDIPLPVLVADPYKGGFVEALPKADIARMLKERGLMPKVSSRESDKEAERKNKAETVYRLVLAEQLLDRADNVDDVELFEDLIIPMAVQLYVQLDNDCTKRVHKLLAWDAASISPRDSRVKLVKHFAYLTASDLNKFLIAASIASELRVAQYYNPGSHALDTMSTILQVDAKAIKAGLTAEAKATEKAKADKAAFVKPSVLARRAAKVAELKVPDLAPTAWRDPSAADVSAMKTGDRVRVISDANKLQKSSRVYNGLAGQLAGRCGPDAWLVKFDNVAARPSIHVSELQIPAEVQLELPVSNQGRAAA